MTFYVIGSRIYTMKERTQDEWLEYVSTIKCPDGWLYATEQGKYRVFVSKTDPLRFYLYKRLFYFWWKPMFIFQV